MNIDETVKSTGVIENEFEQASAAAQVSDVSPEVPAEVPGISFNFDWLKTPTGDGAIEDYIEHPLNFMKSKGLAQMLRGFTGFFGNLKLAVIDIVLGAMQFIKERRTTGTQTVPGGGNNGNI